MPLTVMRWSFAPAFVLVLFLSRWLLAPPRIITFDGANFAFALMEFNPSEHKPQPPGYPLYVGLTRLIHHWIDDVPRVFVVAGFIGSLIAVAAVAGFAKDLSGQVAALASGMLLMFHPAFWTAGLLNPVRIFFAAASAVVALFAWRAWQKDSPFLPMLTTWAALGLFSGLRPSIVLLLGPLCFWAGVRRGNSPKEWLLSAFAVAALTIPAVSASVWASGGLSAYTALLESYADEQFHETSVFFGALDVAALKMAGRALIWSVVPAFCWLWLMPLAQWRVLKMEAQRVGLFLLLWSGPSLAFVTLVHSAEPGHVLTVVVPVCLGGGLMVALAGNRFRPSWWTSVAIAAPVALTIYMFFNPPSNVMRVSSVVAVNVQADRVIPALDLLDDAIKHDSVTVIASPASSVPWRIIAWYHPDVPVVILDPDPARPALRYWLFRRGHLQADGSGRIPILDCGRQMWLLPEGSPTPEGVTQVQQQGLAMLSTALAGSTMRLSDVEFEPSLPCVVPRPAS